MSIFEKVLGISVVIIVCIAACIGILIAFKLMINWLSSGNNPLKKYHRNPKGTTLSQAEQRALNVGAILAEANIEFCDSLQTNKRNAIAIRSLKQTMVEWWGINSGEDAMKTLEQLKNEGHRQIFNVILSNASETIVPKPSFEVFRLSYDQAGLSIIDEEISKEYNHEAMLVEKHIDVLHAINAEASEKEIDHLIDKYKELFDGDETTFSLCIQIYETVLNKYNAYVMYANNLQQTLEKLRHYGIVDENTAFDQINPAAWDMGRMVNVARWCYTCGYIEESKAWEYIFLAEKESSSCYTDWEDFSKAYLIGRALWGGENERLDVTINNVEGLLKDQDSPWHQMPLRVLSVL